IAESAIIARFRVTGLNAPTRYDGEVIATFMSAATIAKILSKKKDLLCHEAIAQTAMTTSIIPTSGSKLLEMCDATIIARSSLLWNASFGSRPCHSQTNAIERREQA